MQKNNARMCITARMAIAAACILLAVLAAMDARASLPIVIEYGVGRNKTAMKFWRDAEAQLKKGEVENARRSLDAALRNDPTFWPALYTRANVFLIQGKPELAIQDCSEALRQYPAFFEAALLRASANAALGRYAESLKEIEHVIRIRPRTTGLARALSDRAWLRATCPDPSFRNGRQAIKDAKAACGIMSWDDEDMIDTLAAAYAEVGDFHSAVSYEEKALATKGISANDSNVFQSHLALFKQHQPVRSSR
jgi:tetratricopeptide (TPR) repeat protein